MHTEKIEINFRGNTHVSYNLFNPLLIKNITIQTL